MKAVVELHIEQILDGVHYRGYVKIGESTIKYELEFAIPLSKKELSPSESGVDGEVFLKKYVLLKVTRNGVEIGLTDHEYLVFICVIGDFVVNFYLSPLACECRNTLSRPCEFGKITSALIGMTVLKERDFTPVVHDILNSPKFGCALPTA